MSVTSDYWPLVLDSLKEKVSSSNFKAWFSRVEFVSTTNRGRKITVAVPSDFNKKYIEKKLSKEFRESINKFYPQVIHIEYEVSKEEQEEMAPVQQILTLEESELEKMQQKEEKKDSSYLPGKSISNLNPKYTFDNFVITRSNELVANVANGVVKQLGTLYNPLFIHSSVGLGKTHLLQAVGGAVAEQNPSLNIKYLPAETFVNQFILSLQKKEAAKFREYYNSVDVLLIDDIQFIAGKESTQQIFFHLFNELHQQNKQIIITSDKPPKEILGMEERLVSRFEWGMVVDILKPDFEDRVAIIKDKVERMEILLNENQIEKIAKVIDTNVREIEGVLNKIKASMQMIPGRDFTNDDLIKILEGYQALNGATGYVSNNLGAPINPDKILQAVCKLFTLQKSDILGSSRQKDIALARQLTCWFYKNELDLSYPVIGKLLGGRDHTTIMHGCKKVDKLRETDQKMKEKIQLAKKFLQDS